MMNDQVTMLYLRYCYHCEDAARCDNEEQCKACWSLHGHDEPAEAMEGAEATREWLRQAYE